MRICVLHIILAYLMSYCFALSCSICVIKLLPYPRLHYHIIILCTLFFIYYNAGNVNQLCVILFHSIILCCTALFLLKLQANGKERERKRREEERKTREAQGHFFFFFFYSDPPPPKKQFLVF